MVTRKVDVMKIEVFISLLLIVSFDCAYINKNIIEKKHPIASE